MAVIGYDTTGFIERKLAFYLNQQIARGHTEKRDVLIALRSSLSKANPPVGLNFNNIVSITYLKHLIDQELSLQPRLPSRTINPETCIDIFSEGYSFNDIKALSENCELLHGIYVYNVGDDNQLSPISATQRSSFDYDSIHPSRIVYKIFDSQTRHPLKSISKSISSLIFGCAINYSDGFKLESDLDLTLKEFFERFNSQLFEQFKYFELTPDERISLTNHLDRITLRNVLTMTTQLDWNESDTLSLYSEHRQLPAWLFPLLKPPCDHTGFHYSDGDANFLSIIVESLVKMPYTSFADQYFFQPLGITDYTQRSFSTFSDHPTPNCSGGYAMCANDLAKIGQLILNNGSELSLNKYLDFSLTQHIDLKNVSVLRHPEEPTFGSFGYGFFWHLLSITTSSGETLPIISASGIGGQKLYICKTTNRIVITQGGFYNANNPESRSLLYRQCSRALQLNIGS